MLSWTLKHILMSSAELDCKSCSHVVVTECSLYEQAFATPPDTHPQADSGQGPSPQQRRLQLPRRGSSLEWVHSKAPSASTSARQV
jgi:hypothetical protein